MHVRSYYKGDKLIFVGNDREAKEFFGWSSNSQMPIYLCTPTNFKRMIIKDSKRMIAYVID